MAKKEVTRKSHPRKTKHGRTQVRRHKMKAKSQRGNPEMDMIKEMAKETAKREAKRQARETRKELKEKADKDPRSRILFTGLDNAVQKAYQDFQKSDGDVKKRGKEAGKGALQGALLGLAEGSSKEIDKV